MLRDGRLQGGQVRLRKGPTNWQKLTPKLWAGLRSTAPLRETMDTAFAGVDWAKFEADFWTHLQNLK